MAYYGDLDIPSITDEQYKLNLIHQFPHLDSSLPISELECLIDYLQVPIQVRIAYCQVTKSLPTDVQRLIYEATFFQL